MLRLRGDRMMIDGSMFSGPDKDFNGRTPSSRMRNRWIGGLDCGQREEIARHDPLWRCVVVVTMPAHVRADSRGGGGGGS